MTWLLRYCMLRQEARELISRVAPLFDHAPFRSSANVSNLLRCGA